MTEKIGKEIGSNLGIFMIVDTRSWMSEQAKFMRIKVNLPLEKPLKRCGKVASPEGKSFCIQFRYERLPVFCFRCGVMGHDEKHCKKSGQPNQALQYGEWLRAQGGSKAGWTKEKQRRNPFNQQADDMAMKEKVQLEAEDGGYSTYLGGAQAEEKLGNAKSGSLVSVMSVEGEQATQEARQINFQIQNIRPDGIEARKKGENVHGEKGKGENQNIGPTHNSISTVECESDASEIAHMGREEVKNMELQEVTSPVKMDIGLSVEKKNNNKENKAQKKKGKLKKLAQSQNKENEMGGDVASSMVGVKRTLWVDEEEADARRKKKLCGSNSIPFDLSAVSAEQHRREP
nr:hypothetical protein CFP56_28245 [Quercus suber]